MKRRTFEGETEKSLRGQLEYVIFALSRNLEKWERKEFEQVKADLEKKLKQFDN